MLSVITIVHNRTLELGLLLGGLDRQPDRSMFDIVVVAVGSDQPVAEVAGRFPELTVRIQSLEQEPSAGFPYAAARNIGAAASQAASLLFLDADTIPAVGSIAAFASALQRTDAMFTGEVRYLPPAQNGAYPSTDFELRALSRPHPARPEPPERGIALGADPNLLWSVCLAMRRNTFEFVGCFDTGYRGYGAEDTDLTWSAHCHGVSAGLVADATVFHQHHASYEPPLHQAAALVDNAARFFRKWQRWPMEGWLHHMARMGLIDWHPGGDIISLRRSPSQREIDACRQDLAAPFRQSAQ